MYYKKKKKYGNVYYVHFNKTPYTQLLLLSLQAMCNYFQAKCNELVMLGNDDRVKHLVRCSNVL